MSYEEHEARTPIATVTKVICAIVILALGGIGAGIGTIFVDWGDDTSEVLCPLVGALLGIIAGVLITLVLLNLVEIGTNVKKSANAAIGTADGSSVHSAAEELKKYKELLDQGVITEEEFETQKARLLEWL